MIRFDRIELATYSNKLLDPMDFESKRLLNESGSTEPNHEKLQKNFKIPNSFGGFFHAFDCIRFGLLEFDLVRNKFGSFTVTTLV